MAFDLWSRFRKPGPPPRDARQHQPPRPPPVITRLHTKRPPPVPQGRPQDRRGHHRSLPAPVMPRAPAPARKAPVVRTPSRPTPYRGSLKPLQCLHIHFHPKKREAAPPAPPTAKSSRSSKSSKPSRPPHKAITSQQVPPFPPPRGATKPPPRRVHWAPAQAPLPAQPYPYPSYTTSRTSSSQSRKPTSQSHPVIPRYQPPRSSHGLMQLPYRSGWRG